MQPPVKFAVGGDFFLCASSLYYLMLEQKYLKQTWQEIAFLNRRWQLMGQVEQGDYNPRNPEVICTRR